METYLLNKDAAMPDVSACDTPIRPINPGDDLTAPKDREPPDRPAPASFINELLKILSDLSGR
jgi:hypothetical protein